jgi:hypothetical protein
VDVDLVHSVVVGGGHTVVDNSRSLLIGSTSLAVSGEIMPAGKGFPAFAYKSILSDLGTLLLLDCYTRFDRTLMPVKIPL